MFATASTRILPAALIALLMPILAAAQSAPPSQRAQVMVLGVYHFANPNADMVQSNFPDHLSPRKQKEIEILVDLLAKFRPTKIIVEAVPENEKVRSNYLAYRGGSYQLTANEIEQIGFRLARRLGHQEVFQGDHKIGMDISHVMTVAKETGNSRFLGEFQRVVGEVQTMQKRHESMTVVDALSEMNEPSLQSRTRDLYFQLLSVRSKGKFEGADVLSAWYQRNFRIFANVVQVIESSSDRVLVIFGQGHAPYLRDAVKAYPDLQLVEPNDYLKQK